MPRRLISNICSSNCHYITQCLCGSFGGERRDLLVPFQYTRPRVCTKPPDSTVLCSSCLIFDWMLDYVLPLSTYTIEIETGIPCSRSSKIYLWSLSCIGPSTVKHGPGQGLLALLLFACCISSCTCIAHTLYMVWWMFRSSHEARWLIPMSTFLHTLWRIASDCKLFQYWVEPSPPSTNWWRRWACLRLWWIVVFAMAVLLQSICNYLFYHCWWSGIVGLGAYFCLRCAGCADLRCFNIGILHVVHNETPNGFGDILYTIPGPQLREITVEYYRTGGTLARPRAGFANHGVLSSCHSHDYCGFFYVSSQFQSKRELKSRLTLITGSAVCCTIVDHAMMQAAVWIMTSQGRFC